MNVRGDPPNCSIQGVKINFVGHSWACKVACCLARGLLPYTWNQHAFRMSTCPPTPQNFDPRHQSQHKPGSPKFCWPQLGLQSCLLPGSRFALLHVESACIPHVNVLQPPPKGINLLYIHNVVRSGWFLVKGPTSACFQLCFSMVPLKHHPGSRRRGTYNAAIDSATFHLYQAGTVLISSSRIIHQGFKPPTRGCLRYTGMCVLHHIWMLLNPEQTILH